MCSSPKLTDLDLKGVDTVAVDLETYDPDLKNKGSGAVRGNGFVCGIAIATGKQTLYFPLKHVMTDNIPRKKAWDYLNKKLFQNPNIKKVRFCYFKWRKYETNNQHSFFYFDFCIIQCR